MRTQITKKWISRQCAIRCWNKIQHLRSKECCTSGLISAQVRGILFVFVGAILALLLEKIPSVL